jgi:hypothetical protein
MEGGKTYMITIQVLETSWKLSIDLAEKLVLNGNHSDIEHLLDRIAKLQNTEQQFYINIEGCRPAVVKKIHDKLIELKTTHSHIRGVTLFPTIYGTLVVNESQWDLTFVPDKGSRRGHLANPTKNRPSIVLVPVLHTITVFGPLQLTVRGKNKAFLNELKQCIKESDRIFISEEDPDTMVCTITNTSLGMQKGPSIVHNRDADYAIKLIQLAMSNSNGHLRLELHGTDDFFSLVGEKAMSQLKWVTVVQYE